MDDVVKFETHLDGRGRSPCTVRSYSAAVRRVLSGLDDIQLADVTPVDLAEWKRHRCVVAKPATVNLEIDALRQFFRWAHAEGLIPSDPSSRLKHVSESSRLAPRWLTRKEQHRLLRAVQKAVQAANTDERKTLAVRDGALVALMLHAGLRVAEACALQATDLAISERKGSVVVRNGKGGKRREVPLNQDAREAIAEWLSWRGGGGGPLFPGDKGGHLTTRSAQVAIRRLGVSVGLHVTSHQLRHTFCHELIERGGVPLDRVALLAGHTTVTGLPRLQTTVRYTLPSEGELDDAVQSLEWG